LEKVQKLVEKIYEENKQKRKGRELTGYIMDFDDEKVTVRWEYQAPEIDEYDIIKKKNIISGEIGLGEKILYKL